MSTCRDEVLAAATRLAAATPDGTFTPEQVVQAMTREGTIYAPSTIRTHVVSRMCVGAARHHARVYDDLEPAGDHRYRVLNKQGTRSQRSSTTIKSGPAPQLLDETPLPDVPAGDSTIQRQAETVALAELSLHLGVHLVPERLRLTDESYIDVDGVSHDPPILVEVWAHQGPPKSAQRNKVTCRRVQID